MDVFESNDIRKELKEGVKVIEIDSIDKSDIKKNEMDIKVEVCDKDKEECGKQKIIELKIVDIDEDKIIVLEFLLSFNREQNLLDEVFVKDVIIFDIRIEELEYFKGLGLARILEVKKIKVEMKKILIKSYLLRRRSIQGGVLSERKGDFFLYD